MSEHQRPLRRQSGQEQQQQRQQQRQQQLQQVIRELEDVTLADSGCSDGGGFKSLENQIVSIKNILNDTFILP